MFRIATKDVTLGGVDIPAGSRIVVIYSSANRDEALFSDPDEFDPDRANLKEHLAFGKGIHFCLGAALSRLEGRVALQELSRRLDTITLPDTNRYEYFPSFMLRGLTSLDVDFTAAGPSHERAARRQGRRRHRVLHAGSGGGRRSPSASRARRSTSPAARPATAS